MSKHTRTPWNANDERSAHVFGEGFRIVICNSGEITRDKANARHIVKCVNAHDELVEALRDCADSLEHDHRAQRDLMVFEVRDLLAELDTKGEE